MGPSAHASDPTFDKLTYRISATHFVDSMALRMWFNAVEVLEVAKSSGETVSIEDKITGTVNWPTTPGGFSAVPLIKYIEYKDNEGHVQKDVKVDTDTIEGTWSTHNVILADGRITKEIGDARVSEIRFVAISSFEARHVTSMAWENLYWIGMNSRAYIGPGHEAGQEVETWVTKWISNSGIITPEPVKFTLGSLSNVKTAAGTFDTLVGGANFRAVHPSRVASGDMLLDYSYTFFWDKRTGVLVKFEAIGHSLNPTDRTETRVYYELTDLKTSSGTRAQVLETTKTGTTVLSQKNETSVKAPAGMLGLQLPVSREFLGIAGPALGGLAAVFGFLFKTRKHRTAKSYLRTIESTFNELSGDQRRCKERMLAIKNEVASLYKKGKIDEAQYGMLSSEIESYLEKL